MKIRLRLVLAFFLLAVVPLTGLVLYSYYASLQAVRQSTEEEAIATIEELERRMSEVRGDLTADLQRLASSRLMPDGEGPVPSTGAAGSADPEAVEQQLRALVNQLVFQMGDNAGFVEGMEVIAPDAPVVVTQGVVLPPTAAPEPPAVTAPASPLPPSAEDAMAAQEEPDAFQFSGRLDIDLETLEDHEELGQLVQTLQKGASVMEALGALQGIEDGAETTLNFGDRPMLFKVKRSEDPDAANRWQAFISSEVDASEDLADAPPPAAEPNAPESAEARAARRQERRQQMETARRQADLRRRAARTEAQEQKAQERARVRWGTEELLGQEFAIPLREGDRLMGNVRLEIRADALLERVLEFSDRDQGEVPFALDPEGQLFMADEADEEVLSQLDLSTMESPNVQRIGNQPWVVAALQESEGDFTFGIARPLGEPMAEVRRTAKRNFAYGLGLIVLALFGIAPLSRRISSDLMTVTQGAERIAAGDLETRVEVRSSDEIGQLATTFNSMAAQLAEHEAHRAEAERRRRNEALERQQLEAEVDRKGRELEEARQFQLSLLPKRMPQHPAFRMAVEIRTATEVGGDYYDYCQEGESLILAIGDATGHGARAGTMVTVTKSLFSAYRPGNDPGAFLQDATETIRRMELGRMSMALSVADLHPDRLTLAAAGMPPALLYRAATGRVEELSLPGLPLGSRLPSTYESTQVGLQKGDTLLFATDGVPELLSGDNGEDPGEIFGYQRLRDTFQRVAAQSPADVIEALSQTIDAWCGGTRPNDDITVLVIERQ